MFFERQLRLLYNLWPGENKIPGVKLQLGLIKGKNVAAAIAAGWIWRVRYNNIYAVMVILWIKQVLVKLIYHYRVSFNIIINNSYALCNIKVQLN